jgi:hypothetical protein
MKNIYLALSKFQAKVKNIELNSSVQVKTTTGGSYKFDYATLGQIWNDIRPLLGEFELFVTQSITEGHMVTKITHSSGEELISTLPLPPIPTKPQEIGSVITYFRRYGLVTALGLVAEDDDDANVAEGNEVQKVAKNYPFATGTNAQGKTWYRYKTANDLVWLDAHSYEVLVGKYEKGLSIADDLEVIKRKQNS